MPNWDGGSATERHKSSNESSIQSTKKTLAEQARRVFDYWQKQTGKTQSKFDTKRESRITSRLREGFSVEKLTGVVDKAVAEPFHRGDNDRGKVYLGIQTIFRDAEKVESWFDKRPTTVPKATNEPLCSICHQPKTLPFGDGKGKKYCTKCWDKIVGEGE